MKKFIFLLTLVSFGAFIPTAFGTSGACSYHGGVSCAAGSDYDGSVICYDGWRDSGVSYSSMSECNLPPYTPLCIPPSSEDCDTGSLAAINARRGLSGSSFGSSAMAQCQATHDAYLRSQTVYQQCLDNLSLNTYAPTTPATPPTPVVDEDVICKAQFGSAAKKALNHPGYCVCFDDFMFNAQGTQCVSKYAYCTQTLGEGAVYDVGAKKCSCGAGYLLMNDACVGQNLYCQQKSGIYSYYDSNTNKCACSANYQMDAAGACVFIMPQTVATPVTTPSATTTSTIPPANSALQGGAASVSVPNKKFVTAARRVNVRSTPSTGAKVLGVTAIKAQYELLDQSATWVKVQFGKKVGWILRSLVSIK